MCLASYVTADAGTGVVHSAPAFGVDDFEACKAAGIVSSESVPCPVDDNGNFTAPVTPWLGMHVKAADLPITIALKQAGRVFASAKFKHSYPFCWRSDTPLIYKAVPSWFIKVESIKKQLVANNLQTYWVPAAVQEKRFHNWLESAQDWCVSRNRFWGTPIPLWISPDGKEKKVVTSVAMLQSFAPEGFVVKDLHSHNVDHITIPDSRGPDFPPLRRVEEVFDWYVRGVCLFFVSVFVFFAWRVLTCPLPDQLVRERLDAFCPIPLPL